MKAFRIYETRTAIVTVSDYFPDPKAVAIDIFHGGYTNEAFTDMTDETITPPTIHPITVCFRCNRGLRIQDQMIILDPETKEFARVHDDCYDSKDTYQ